jgi:hypothetical protein
MESDTKSRREALDRLEHMSRGVPIMSLNHGQDFDGKLRDLEDLLRPDLTFDLESALPAIRQAQDHGEAAEFHSAHYVERHAPTSLSPEGPKWYERAPVISWAVTMYDHLRDYPRSSRGQRI